MTADHPDYPYFLIDGPSPFASVEELLAFRSECRAMLVAHPNHPQWQSELDNVDQALASRLA